MLEVVRLLGGRYALRNTWTGVLLTKKNGNVRLFRTTSGALRYARRSTRNLNKLINSLDKRY